MLGFGQSPFQLSIKVNMMHHPRSKCSYGPNSSSGSNSSCGSKSSYEHHRANSSVSQGKSKGYEYVHYSSNHYVHKSSNFFCLFICLLEPLFYEMKCTGFNAIFLLWSSQNDEFFATPSDVGGEEKQLMSYAGSGLQTNLIV